MKTNAHRVVSGYVLPFILMLVVYTSCGQSNGKVNQLKSDFKSGKVKVDDVLTSEKYIDLHGDPAFRELMKAYAPIGNISIVTDKEPGQRITLKGIVVDQYQKPAKNVLFYFYHTMHDGLYAENKEEPGKAFQGQQSVAKLFGYVRTDSEGRFEINTIRPAGYPGEKFPSHVHIEIYDQTGKIRLGTEFQFADDPRLDNESRENSIRFGNLVSDNVGSTEEPVYYYKITLPK